jgi:2-hydroxychromene-2-carboxylate isomerase
VSALREALERACAAEDVDLTRIEDYVKVANMAGFQDLAQSRWVRVIWRLLQEANDAEV